MNSEENKLKPGRPPPAVPAIPTVPTIPNVIIKSQNNPQNVYNNSTAPVGVVKPRIQAINECNNLPEIASIAPALPPLNPGSNPRPLISSPILKASTCTAKELISPLRTAPKVPLRSAPEVPDNPRPLSSPINPTVAVILEEITLKPKEIKEPKEPGGSTLNRIASFLSKSKDDKIKEAPVVKLSKSLDKDKLKNIEISNPIPQGEIPVPTNAVSTDEIKTRPVVMRAQSMRGNNVTPRPHIQTFGSMRQANGAKRPTSIPVGNRPKSPPPPRPPLPEVDKNKIPGLAGYQEPNVKPKPVVKTNTEYQYDDCLNEAPLAKISEEISPSSGDNIYAVIEETPKSLSSDKSSSNSSESVGLLGEIVSEIQNRNFDSIYSTSTLARKKKEMERERLKIEKINNGDNSENYVNTSSFYKTPESVYSNMGNLNQSSASSTASGYIHPSAVNAPAPKPITTPEAKKILSPKDSLSTFKSDPKDISTYKPYHSTLQRSVGPFASTFKNTPSKIEDDKKKDSNEKKIDKTPPETKPPEIKEIKTESKPPTEPTKPKTVARQVTPVNLRTRKPSPSRIATPRTTTPPRTATKPPTTSNSPDLVISCSTTTTAASNPKSPDVLNSSAKINSKPNGALPTKPVTITAKPVPKAKTPTERKPVGKPSIVAAKNLNKTSDNKPPSVGARIPSKTQPSTVAALQQKFENKNQVGMAKTK